MVVYRYVEVSIEEWLEEKQKEQESAGIVDIIFRPFLKWLDRKLEDVVTDGLKQMKRELLAKAAGLTFVPVKQLRKTVINEQATSASDGDDSEGDSDESDPEPFMRAYRKGQDSDEVYTGIKLIKFILFIEY